ncbi:MAG TPA: MBOAT family O-acyltransferase, partial [Cyclobacteriaceae bacterium]|nr:MBOAT family O-acyltransferase [Cyclobacteriaceae bacterium]
QLALYVSLFPQLIAGPIVRYADVEDDLDKRKHSLNEFAYGVERFIFGLAKKVLIANQVAFYVDKIFAIPDQELSTHLVWLAIIGYAVQIYFDFSAYSDMAIGLGRMFGFRFMENFNHPYTAISIQDFWRRWHISLSTWFRDYLYIPLGGSRHGTFNTYRNLLIVFFLTGLWHGASYNFIIWGMLHGSFLMLERTGFNELLNRTPRFFRSAYVIIVVLIGWVFFRASDLPQAFSFLTKMFSYVHNPAADAHLVFLVDANFIIVLLAGILFSVPVRKFIFQDCFYEKPTAFDAKRMVYTIVIVATFMISIIYLAAGTYNPFIYFRF